MRHGFAVLVADFQQVVDTNDAAPYPIGSPGVLDAPDFFKSGVDGDCLTVGVGDVAQKADVVPFGKAYGAAFHAAVVGETAVLEVDAEQFHRVHIEGFGDFDQGHDLGFPHLAIKQVVDRLAADPGNSRQLTDRQSFFK
ncbi:MAG: hypothetical protein RI964_2405 [Pseudomonadota bacterium]